MTQPTLTADELQSLAHLGWTHLERERLDDAQKIFAGLTVLAPQLSYAWHALGIIAKKRGDMERAIGCLKHAHGLASEDTEVLLSLGEAHKLAGQDAQARGALARVITTRHASSGQLARARAMM